MNPETVVAALDARHDGNAFPFETLLSRLSVVVDSATTLWTPDDICSAVSFAFHETTAYALSNNQVLRVATMIRSIWPLYPLNVHARSRHAVLHCFLSGDHWSVKQFSLERPVERPVEQKNGDTPIEVIDVDAHDKNEPSIVQTPSLAAGTPCTSSPPRKRQCTSEDDNSRVKCPRLDNSSSESPSGSSSSSAVTTSAPAASSRVIKTTLLDLLARPKLSSCFMKHLSLADIHHLRFAGVGSNCNFIHSFMHKYMRKRVQQLEQVLNDMPSENFTLSFNHTVQYTIKDRKGNKSNFTWEELLYTPRTIPVKSVGYQGKFWPPPIIIARICSGRNFLILKKPSASDLRTVYAEFSSLTGMKCMFPFRRFDGIPAELGLCTQLRALRLSGNAKVIHFPLCVLQLRYLKLLVIVSFTKLSSLPEDIGKALRHLKFIYLQDCGGLQSLPSSLLNTLEANFQECEFVHGICLNAMPKSLRNVLARRLSIWQHPNLWRNLKKDGAYYGNLKK